MANPPNNKPPTPGVFTTQIQGTFAPIKNTVESCRTCGYPGNYYSMVPGPAGLYCTVRCKDQHEAYIKSHLGLAPNNLYRQAPLVFDDIPIEGEIEMKPPKVVAPKVPVPKRFNTKWSRVK